MEEQDFWGFNFEGETYDCGDKLGFLLANVAYGLDREDIGPAFRGSLARMLLRSERSFEGDYSTPTTLDCARSAQWRTDCRLMRGVVEPIRREPVKLTRLFKEY